VPFKIRVFHGTLNSRIVCKLIFRSVTPRLSSVVRRVLISRFPFSAFSRSSNDARRVNGVDCHRAHDISIYGMERKKNRDFYIHIVYGFSIYCWPNSIEKFFFNFFFTSPPNAMRNFRLNSYAIPFRRSRFLYKNVQFDTHYNTLFYKSS